MAESEDEDEKYSGETSDLLISPAYGKDALDKLRAEQKMKPKTTEEEAENTKRDDGVESRPEIGAMPGHSHLGIETSPLSSFIPLSSDKKLDVDAVLAIRLQEQMEMDSTAQNTGDWQPPPSILHEGDPPEEEPSDWEEQITRRAGILQPAKNSSKQPLLSPLKLPSLDAVRQQLQSTLGNLSSQQEDIGNAIMRREADLAQSESDLKRHKQALQEAGDACNDYQGLRHDLAMWVGALRDLEQKVEPIFESLTKMISSQYASAQQEWTDLQEDVVSVLLEANVLETVVGRQPRLPSVGETASTVDEFGRDVQSQYVRERERRYRRRMKRPLILDSDSRGDETDDVLYSIWIEDSDNVRRCEILQEALGVALDDLEQDYTSVHKLVAVFEGWKKSHSNEYQQCYANLSLGDIATVLVKVEFCRSRWIVQVLRQSTHVDYDGSMLSSIVTELRRGEINIQDEEGAVQRMLGKTYVPFLLSLLNDSAASCFLCSEKSGLLLTSLAETFKNFDETSMVIEKVQTALVRGIGELLNNISIPLVQDGVDIANDGSERHERRVYAIKYAKIGQVACLQRLLLNLLNAWVPFVQNPKTLEELGRCILDFISSKYLFLLSSMPREKAQDAFAPIWQQLKRENSKWLDSPSFFLESAPIRAAATAYALI
jgi:hypothetical protein